MMTIFFRKSDFAILDIQPEGSPCGVADGVCFVEGEVDDKTITLPVELQNKWKEETAKNALAATDGGVIRGVDDLWALLVSKGVIRAEDVPPLLKAKLDARAALRADLSLIQTAEK